MRGHIYFSGIGGAGIGPLALIAKQAGYEVSGSDKQDSDYLKNLRSKGIKSIHIGQTEEAIRAVHDTNQIDWLVYSSAVEKEHEHHPELVFADKNNIRRSKRDEFLQKLLDDTDQKMIAIAGTHGKTTTTAMVIWLFKELGLPVSYSVGGKLSFGGVGEFNPQAKYFVYEADEYDRNFLAFQPQLSIIPGIAYDHPDIYPTTDDYNNAFLQFIHQSEQIVMWEDDANRLGKLESTQKMLLMNKEDYPDELIKLPGRVNRENAHLVAQALLLELEKEDIVELQSLLCSFPGVSRRFEKLADNLYTDYAHTPEKIKGALQLTREIAGDNVVVIYEGLHNTRQHFIREQLADIFRGCKKLYVVPSYKAREDESLEDLTPEKLVQIIQSPDEKIPAELNNDLREHIRSELDSGNLVLCLSAGGGGSLDEWLRKEFA